MKRILFVGLCVLGIQGCTTPYQKMGASGGVESTIIDDNVFQVKASVNGYTQKSVATQYAIRKAAEVSQSLGCNYYSAINNTSQSYDQNTSKTNSGLMTENGGVYYTTSAGTRYRIVKPSSRNTYVCFNEKPDTVLPGLVFNIKYVLSSELPSGSGKFRVPNSWR
ncbi:CC0125/CC1285 family lipoprotein [Acinetobacter sp. ESBL14]|uniref:CC0125/CC1285 family lipoprotein n=2 Tax=Acinetobacter sp. ESBL14 TaxID=3077329 RepID=UPI002FCC8CF8